MKSILALITLTAVSAAATCTPINPVLLTFYGYPDNDPPSADIAYDCGRGYKASGNGTYNNPLTAASAAPGEFNKCEVLYLPYLRKYVIIEDTCAQCIKNWKQNTHHVDIWIGPTETNNAEVVDCEKALTPKQASGVIREPGVGYEVVTGMCNTGYTYLADHVSGSCGGGVGPGAGVGSATGVGLGFGPANEDNIQDEDGGNDEDEDEDEDDLTSGASKNRWDSALPASLGVLHLCYAILDGLIRI